jgi:heme A synthase
VGLAVPDWPLCFSKLNPEGWWKIPALLLEHGHRWMGSLIGTLVLVQYIWQAVRYRPRLIEFAGIGVIGVGFLVLIGYKALIPAGGIALMAFLWLGMSWAGQRWPLLRGLTVAALFLVILQAALGGLRVLKMSDSYGIAHGTTGQLFYCLLLFIAFASSRTWQSPALTVPVFWQRRAKVWSTVLFLSVFCQLVFGAILRHTQRTHLAAQDILTTKGDFWPEWGLTDVFMLHLHKYWGFTVALLVLVVAGQACYWLSRVPKLRWLPLTLFFMPINQVVLGIYVIRTGKSFWVTNLHVLNGLGILALSFLLMLSIRRACHRTLRQQLHEATMSVKPVETTSGPALDPRLPSTDAV